MRGRGGGQSDKEEERQSERKQGGQREGRLWSQAFPSCTDHTVTRGAPAFLIRSLGGSSGVLLLVAGVPGPVDGRNGDFSDGLHGLHFTGHELGLAELAQLVQQNVVSTDAGEERGVEDTVAHERAGHVVDGGSCAAGLHVAVDEVVEGDAETVEVLDVHLQQAAVFGREAAVLVLLGEVGTEDSPGIVARDVLDEGLGRAARVHGQGAEARGGGAHHHADVADERLELLVGHGAGVVERASGAGGGPGGVADQRLDDVLVVVAGQRHEGVELGGRGDGPHALPGVGVGVLHDGVAAHRGDPHGHGVLGDVAHGVRAADLDVALGVAQVEHLVGLVGHHLVAAAGEAGEHGVEDEGLGNHGQTGPGCLGDVAEGRADAVPLAVLSADLEDEVRALLALAAHPADRRVGVVLVHLGDEDLLAGHVREGGGVAGGLHGVLVVDDGEGALGQHAGLLARAHGGEEGFAHEAVVAAVLAVVVLEWEGLLPGGARVGLHDDHLAVALGVGDVEEVGAGPHEHLVLAVEHLEERLLVGGGLQVTVARGDTAVAQGHEGLGHGVQRRVHAARVPVVLGVEGAGLDVLGVQETLRPLDLLGHGLAFLLAGLAQLDGQRDGRGGAGAGRVAVGCCHVVAAVRGRRSVVAWWLLWCSESSSG